MNVKLIDDAIILRLDKNNLEYEVEQLNCFFDMHDSIYNFDELKSISNFEFTHDYSSYILHYISDYTFTIKLNMEPLEYLCEELYKGPDDFIYKYKIGKED